MEGGDEGMSGEQQNMETNVDSESDEEDVDMPTNDNDLEQMLHDAEGNDLGGRQYDKFLGPMEYLERHSLVPWLQGQIYPAVICSGTAQIEGKQRLV